MTELENIHSLIERIEGKKLINEGIDIDYISHLVSYNPSHQNNVDTSIETNPTVSTEYGDGIKVYSILKRKSGSTMADGNPLLYAFKKEKGWAFKSEKDKEDILKQIDLITDKFISMYPLGFTILIPSGNLLNRMIGNMLKTKSDSVMVVDDVLTKITTEEVFEIASAKGSPFLKYYKESIDSALRQLSEYLKKMNEEKNGYFTRHYVTDANMRNVLTKTLKLSTDSVARYSKLIDGKDILLIDDSISRGQTIMEACQILQENYSPTSITVLTLFSKLYKDDR